MVDNGGGIWVSSNGGDTWSKPSTGNPPKNERIPNRTSAYGISWAPDKRGRVYVGTDYGVATSLDFGKTWSHEMLHLHYRQNAVFSILALRDNKVIALCNEDLYLKNDTSSWKALAGYGRPSYTSNFKNMDVWPSDYDKVLILRNPSSPTLSLYDFTSSETTGIPLPPSPSFLPMLGRFVRISRSNVVKGAFDIWVGTNINLLRVTCRDIDSLKRLKSTDWMILGESSGIHTDSGYIGLDNNLNPILYGCSGGLFKPLDPEAFLWTIAATSGCGLNSYKISDLAGTNLGSYGGKVSSLYFTTDDNGIWASSDYGSSWPNHDSDSMSGFSLQVQKDVASDTDVTVAYSKFADGLKKNMFSDANLQRQRVVPDIDMADASLSDMSEAFLISKNNWIRFKLPKNGPKEIYISQNNGLNWDRKAFVKLDPRGGFSVSVSGTTTLEPVIYAPFRAPGFHTETGGEIIGLIKFTRIFDREIPTYDETNLIYLPEKGSLGMIATGLHSHAVFGVNPKDALHIIAPDIYNQVVKVSHDGGRNWTTDSNLTNEVTNAGRLLLYDGDSSHMQVTQISFDPYDSERIVVGTRDAGIIISKNGGTTWTTQAGSEQITYITNFFFRHDKSIIVSSYGRGLWEFNSRHFPVDYYCPDDCRFRLPRKPHPPVYETTDWIHEDVIIFLNGRVNGLVLKQNEVKTITITPGTVYERYIGETKNHHELDIIESEDGAGFDGLKGCLAALQEGDLIKGIILKENEIFGIISGKQEFKQNDI